MRRRIYEIVEVNSENDKMSGAYDFFMMLTIIISIIPLCTHSETAALGIAIVALPAGIIIADYQDEISEMREKEEKEDCEF